MPIETAPGLTVRDVARRYRVGEDKVRGWITRGDLPVNTAASLCGKPRWVVPAEALAEFERRRAGGSPTPVASQATAAHARGLLPRFVTIERHEPGSHPGS